MADLVRYLHEWFEVAGIVPAALAAGGMSGIPATKVAGTIPFRLLPRPVFRCLVHWIGGLLWFPNVGLDDWQWRVRVVRRGLFRVRGLGW